MKGIIWFALATLNAVGIVLTVFGIGYGDTKTMILQAFSVIFCLFYGFSEVKE
nr:MAG TPA: hypothetical protein [Caudoviricetes sp.]